jgi:Spy/CpxP family protein refolding chaperone
MVMKNILSPRSVLSLLIVFLSAGFICAQDNPRPDFDRPPIDERPQGKRPNLLRILGLSPAQLEQVRRINQERKPLMDSAMRRLGQANRALDEAIYSDTFDQALFDTRLKELQTAQAEVARLRFTGEMNIRKVLTPEQLSRFRDLRRQFAPPPPQQQRPMPQTVDDKNFIRQNTKVP